MVLYTGVEQGILISDAQRKRQCDQIHLAFPSPGYLHASGMISGVIFFYYHSSCIPYNTRYFQFLSSQLFQAMRILKLAEKVQ
jgi:hypothetical protein